jgi:phosphoserine phosphatase
MKEKPGPCKEGWGVSAPPHFEKGFLHLLKLLVMKLKMVYNRSMKPINLEQIKLLIPGDLIKRIEAIELFITEHSTQSLEKIAAFDMDNTLLEGDIGEAVFSQLKLDEQKQPVTVTNTMIPFSWPECHEMMKKLGKKEAYTKMVTAMNGIPVETVIETTRRVMALNIPYLEVEGVRVPVPRPNEVMQALVRYLRNLDYTVYIISATNSYSVQYMAEEYFDIPASHAIGMKPTVMNEEKGGIIGAEIDGPITVGEGKVEAYHRFIGSIPPLVTAGDSNSDIQVLGLTSPQGISIWVGDDDQKYESIRKLLPSPHTAFFLRRETAYPF